MKPISLADAEFALPADEAPPAEEELHLWSWQVDQFDTVPNPCDSLSSDEQSRSEQFAAEEPRRQFLASRVGLRQLLAAYLGCSPGDVEFELAAAGKPRLAGGELGFNLSHSGEVVVAAVSRVEVGVDVERIRPVTNFDALARRILSGREKVLFDQITEDQQLEHFFRLWTRKEATVKLTGLGLQAAVQVLETPAAIEFAGDIAIPSAWQAEITQCWLAGIAMPAEYVAAVACERPPRTIRCRRW